MSRIDKKVNFDIERTVSYILENNLLYTVYQPIIDINKKEVFGYECLLRIRNTPITNPVDMINYAFQFDAIKDVSISVHEKAIRNLDILEPHQKMFLNLHYTNFKDYSNLKDRTNIFYNKDVSKIVFEITERTAPDQIEDIKDNLIDFKKAGIEIAIDDMGAGTSLKILSIIQPDYVKLDISLIRNIDSNEIKQQLVKSILDFCNSFGCKCIAEGVETKAELNVLKSLNCRYIQGFLFSRPEEQILLRGEVNNYVEKMIN